MKFDIKKKLIVASLVGAVTIGASPTYAVQADRESIAQVALLQSLAQGYFGGTVTAGQLRALGDTGIGTFEEFHDLNLAKDMKEDIRSAEQDTKGKLQGEN